MKIENVSSRQVILFIIASRVFVAFSYLPAINIPPGNQDVWIVCLYSIIFTTIIFFPLLYLGKKFNEYSLIQYMEIIFGKHIGKVIGFIYGLFFIIEAVFHTGIETESIGSTMLFNAPNSLKTLLVIMTCTYVVSKGLEVIGRFSEFFTPIIITVVLLLILLGYKNWDFGELLPILKESSIKDINIGAIKVALQFMDLIILFMIIPNLEDQSQVNKIFTKSILYSMILVILPVVACQVTLGREYVLHVNFPFFIYTRLINVGGIIERIELVYVVIWTISAIIKISSRIYLAALTFQQVFKKKEITNIVYIMGVIVYLSSVYIRNRRPLVAVQEPIKGIILILSLISIFIIPLIALIVNYFRKIKENG